MSRKTKEERHTLVLSSVQLEHELVNLLLVNNAELLLNQFGSDVLVYMIHSLNGTFRDSKDD